MSSGSNDGWTHVARKQGGRPPKVTPQLLLADRDITVETLQASYNKYMRTWEASCCRKELREILDKKQPDEGWQIQRAVCLASGSFSRDNFEFQKRSMLQFVAFMDTVQHVQATSNDSIQLYAEEMVYTAVDIDFLNSHGVTVHNDPDMASKLSQNPTAWSYIGSESMVFELFMDMAAPAMQQLLNSNPKLLIGTPLLERLAAVTSDDIPSLINKFKSERGSYYFPRFDEDPSVFGALKVFWKEPVDVDD